MKFSISLLIISIVLSTTMTKANTISYKVDNVEFDHITVNEGLPNNRVDCILQDYEGYLWFGTKRGLCRYNGYDFKNYTSILNDSTSLRYHQISCLLESSDSTIWVGTWAGGLHKYNRKKDNFSRIKTNDQDNIETNISLLHEDSRKNIWIATDGKLYLMKKDDRKNLIEINQPDKVSPLSNVTAIYEDKNGTLYIAREYTSSLLTCNYENKTTKKFQFVSRSNIFPQKINQIYSIDENNLWLVADNGVFNFDCQLGLVEPITQKDAPELGTQVNFIFEAEGENIWLGGNGLFCFNKTDKQFTNFRHLPGDPQSVNGNIFNFGFQDTQQNLWFGTFSQGLNIIFHKTKYFNKNHELSEILENASNNITAIHKNKEGYLFLGTWDKGLLILNDKNEFVQNTSEFSNLKHLENKIIRSIYENNNDIMWIGSENDQLTRFDFETKQAESFKIPGTTNNPGAQITSIEVDSRSRIWTANPTGVFLFDQDSESFTKLLNNANTQDIKEDMNGDIWCANYNVGLCYIGKDNSIIFFKSNERNQNLPNNKFVCIYKDSKNRMWVGTEFNGLFLYHPDTDHFQQFTVKDGLPSNDICSIEEDSKGRLWIGTNNGLSRFTYSLNNFSNYFRSDGMNADEFHYNSSFKSKSGDLYFGCTSGIVFFNPDDIRGNFRTFPVKLEEININHGEVKEDIRGFRIGEALRTKMPLKLKYNQNTINFKFTTLNYSKAKKSEFAYQLEGLDDSYEYAKDQRQVTYTNLKPGKYAFRVIASNNDNIWNRKGTEIRFQIKNPPWLNWWAYTIYGLFIILIVYGLRYQVRHEEKMKTAIKLERMEKEKQRELTQMKLRFFTNISHEFKTPLTLIIGPLEQIIADLHGNSLLKNKLKQINTNSKRLLELINQLIDFRKIEQDVLPLEKNKNNLNETIRKVMDAFNPIAIKNEILFILDNDIDTLEFNYDSDKVEKIMYNIISNAFKYTSKGGSITIRIWQNTTTTVNISITDTGSGITTEKNKRIFERFNTSNNSPINLEMRSSGIGLAFSKKLAELHGGSLKLESKVNKGTVVCIELPYDRHTSSASIINNKNSVYISEITTPAVINKIKTELEYHVDLSHAPQILVVEDDNELRNYIVTILRDIYRVDEAEDGEIGYHRALKNDYDLIVSDVMMPNMSGTQLCRKLKSNIKTSHIHVILLSAKSDFISTAEGYKTGADSYLTKPFYPENLIQVIKNLLSTSQHIKEFYTSPEDTNQEPPGIHPRDKQFILDAIAYIEKNIDEEHLSVETLGKELGLSRTHLFRKFKSLTGSAPYDFIRQVKLKKAAQLLNERKYSISEIAYMVGFKTPANFSTSFKTFYGKSPTEYEKKLQGKT